MATDVDGPRWLFCLWQSANDELRGVRSPIHVTPHLGAAPDLDPIRLTPRHDSFSFNLGVLLLRPNESLATALFAFMAPAAHNSTLMEQREQLLLLQNGAHSTEAVRRESGKVLEAFSPLSLVLL